CFFLLLLPPPCSTLFPYTTLFRSLSESVRQPDESRGALPHHGTGDLGGQRREDHALCLRVGHRRDHQRRGEVSEGKKSRGQDYWRRSIRLPVLRLREDRDHH